MRYISGKTVDEVIKVYSSNNSILETAKVTGLSTVKIRKILITEDLWESDASIKIGNLLKAGMTTEEIADTLYMSVKNVQAYMPYERGIYKGDELSLNAVRSDKYRNRMKKAASMQVVKKKKSTSEAKGINEMEKDKKRKGKNNNNEQMTVLKLHLELDMEYADEEELQILKEYGSMKKSISRDILVPANITLHALNYAILRMFGWQNGHLHNFSLPKDVFCGLTENLFCTWAKMAGVYFRFPTENYEDIYWDDDYREGESIKSWMRKKYTGPYKYKGYGEHYLMNQMEVQMMFARHEEITVHEFIFGAERQPDPYNVRLAEATIDQVINAFADVMCDELLERLPLSEVLCVKNNSKTDFAEIRKYLDSELIKIDVEDALSEYEMRRFRSEKKEQEFLEDYNIPVLPITEQLIYRYDYGDGWKVLISCENTYKQDETGIWKDINGEIPEIETENLEMVTEKHRPVCVEKDGIELIDDVGGIGGFCRMLQTIYEVPWNDEEGMEERDSMIGWAEMMGWTGRRISPKQTL